MMMGAKNSSTHMQRYYYHACSQSEMPRENYSNLADDFQVFGMNEMEALDVFEKFLEMCVKRQITLKPSKVKLLFYEVDFYGWKLDVHVKYVCMYVCLVV